MESGLLRVSNLIKHYRKAGAESAFSSFRRADTSEIVKAVDGVSLSIDSGETLGVVGESGCGKSTLARCILRLEEPTSGQIFFQDQDLLSLKGGKLRQCRRHIQAVFQDPYASLNPWMSIGKIVEEPLVIHGLGTKKERRDRVVELLEMVGIDSGSMVRQPDDFSGGQRQRIAIARALASGPRLLVADEPVSSLDVSIQAQIVNLLADLQKRLSLSILFISHGLPVVSYFCDRVAVMYRGKLVEVAPARRLFENPLHPYTCNLLEAVPEPDPRVRRGTTAARDIPWPPAAMTEVEEGHWVVGTSPPPAPVP